MLPFHSSLKRFQCLHLVQASYLHPAQVAPPNLPHHGKSAPAKHLHGSGIENVQSLAEQVLFGNCQGFMSCMS